MDIPTNMLDGLIETSSLAIRSLESQIADLQTKLDKERAKLDQLGALKNKANATSRPLSGQRNKRGHNKDLVADALRDCMAGLTAMEISRKSGLSFSSVRSAIKQLEQLHRIERQGDRHILKSDKEDLF